MKPEVSHGATKVYASVKVEAVKLIQERGVTVAQAVIERGLWPRVAQLPALTQP